MEGLNLTDTYSSSVHFQLWFGPKFCKNFVGVLLAGLRRLIWAIYHHKKSGFLSFFSL
ncbi:hypothetical protein RHMOL_Rhmol08G0239500 [Rhododendron molle]|uniref:Uncharacterized protein n=1 Tax=Rhododendron molle TaxID=49168 RepID=A0ACC0MS08_RHOML|nr:hypothetical protein RHMOL_Rhmol08G0239500 [Rhododendron molle]